MWFEFVRQRLFCVDLLAGVGYVVIVLTPIDVGWWCLVVLFWSSCVIAKQLCYFGARGPRAVVGLRGHIGCSRQW